MKPSCQLNFPFPKSPPEAANAVGACVPAAGSWVSHRTEPNLPARPGDSRGQLEQNWSSEAAKHFTRNYVDFFIN